MELYGGYSEGIAKEIVDTFKNKRGYLNFGHYVNRVRALVELVGEERVKKHCLGMSYSQFDKQYLLLKAYFENPDAYLAKHKSAP